MLCRAVVVANGCVGEVAAYRRPADTSGGEIVSVSYVIGSAHRGRGFAPRALALLLDAVQVRWSVERFVAEIAPENVASGRVAASVGFVEDHAAAPIPRAGKDYSVVPWRLARPLGR